MSDNDELLRKAYDAGYEDGREAGLRTAGRLAQLGSTCHEGDRRQEISRALKHLGADHELLALVGSWGDTLTDADVLKYLREYNDGCRLIVIAQAPLDDA